LYYLLDRASTSCGAFPVDTKALRQQVEAVLTSVASTQEFLADFRRNPDKFPIHAAMELTCSRVEDGFRLKNDSLID
jgi:hypothetical protein